MFEAGLAAEGLVDALDRHAGLAGDRSDRGAPVAPVKEQAFRGV
jgi:hypothetical protein